MASRNVPDDLGTDSPAQPTLASYPVKVVCGRNRSFLSKWYHAYDWLEYSKKTDKAYCFACRNFSKGKQTRNNAFTTDGYNNWSAALENEKGFKAHVVSQNHTDAAGDWEEFKDRQEGGTGIDRLLKKKVISDNHYYLNAIFDCLKFLISNGIAMRGKKETIGSIHDPTDELARGKFLNILELMILRDEKLKTIAGKIPGNAKYTSPKIQNEAIEIFKSILQRKITAEVKASDAECFCVKADGTRDKNNIENICIVLQYVLKGVTIQRLLAIVSVEDLDAKSLTETIVGTLEKCDLPLDMIVSQCYDGASVMSGVRGGVQQLLREKVGRDIPYIHCFNHQLHLAVVNALTGEPKLGQYFDMCGTLYVFLRRQAVASRYDGETLKRLLDNRWSGHLDTVRVVKGNFEDLTLLLLDVSNSDLNGEIVALASGLLQKIITPEFEFLTDFMFKILTILEPINLQLQSDEGNLATAITLIEDAKTEIAKLRSQEKFDKIKVKTTATKANAEGDEAVVPLPKRKRRLPARLKDSIVMTPIPHLSIIDDQKRLYYAVIDCVETELDYRFSEVRTPIAEAVNTFNPSDPNFLNVEKLEPLVEAYFKEIDMSIVRNEAKVAKRLFIKDPATSFYKHHKSLHTLYTLWAISKTVGSSTASCENSFSALT